MSTQTRRFTVFKDEPEEAPKVVPRRAASEDGPTASPTQPTLVLLPSSTPALVYCPDKENIDPLSGSRVLSEQSLGKKRKTALAAKAAPASPSKKPRPLAEKPTKKVSSSKSRAGTEKKTKAKRSSSSSSKRVGASRMSREPSLPPLVEEGEEAVEVPMDQQAINAKCKDLTVLPLADISEAYEQAAFKVDVLEAAVRSANEKVVAELSVQSIERPATPPPAEKQTTASSPAAMPSTFSTPERKRIYSAFTFSSPSLASERYASARGSSVDRFSDTVF